MFALIISGVCQRDWNLPGVGFVAAFYLPLSATPPILQGHVKSFIILLTTVGIVCPLSVVHYPLQTCHILGMAIRIFDLKLCKNPYQSVSLIRSSS